MAPAAEASAEARRPRRLLTASAVVHGVPTSTRLRTPTVQLWSHSGERKDVRPGPLPPHREFLACGDVRTLSISLLRPSSFATALEYRPPLLLFLSSPAYHFLFLFLLFGCCSLSFPACHALPQRSSTPCRVGGNGARQWGHSGGPLGNRQPKTTVVNEERGETGGAAVLLILPP